ncbi:MAG: hypothetical protein HRU11_01185 [Parvularculaceae bacterium]|nr:hypothetical protein [Parvularculaceae bacterium]
MWKILKFGLFGWLVLSVLTLPLYWPFIRMFWVFLPMIEAPDYEPPTSVVEARMQDVDYLGKLTQYDRSFTFGEAVTFAAKLDAANERASSLTDAEFYLALAEAVAVADNGHTNLSYRPQYTEFSTIGARLYEFSDGTYILRAAADKAATLGHRVVEVEGVPVEELRPSLYKYKGGNETWRKLYSTLLIESPDLLSAAGHAASSEAIELTLEAPDGTIETVSFDALPPDETVKQPWRAAWYTINPDTQNPIYEGWSHVLDDGGVALPAYLTKIGATLSYVMEGNGLYIRALPGFSAGEQSIPAAYKEMLTEHEDGSLDYLVLDFRLHDGGDYTKSMKFAKTAPNKVKEDGHIYIITGPNTFSAGIVTVAMLKYYAGDRGMIIGEQMGDREKFWAERGGDFRLPNSAYYVNYATGYHDWEKGCKGEPYCYTMNEMYEVPAGSLSPTVPLPLDFESYRRGEDVVMDWIAARH